MNPLLAVVGLRSDSLAQEEQFAKEFLQRDGLRELIRIIEHFQGNTLAVRCVDQCLDDITIDFHHRSL